VRLAWLNDPVSYASRRIDGGKASHYRQVEGDNPDENGYSGPPGWGLGVGLTTSSHNIFNCQEASNNCSQRQT